MIRRRFLFITIIFIICSFMLAAIDVAEDSIFVDFATEKDNVFGFSTEYISSLKDVTSNIETSDVSRHQMEPVISKSVYTTSPFYFYAQIFRRERVKISIVEAPPLTDGTNNLHYNNVGSESFLKDFKGSEGFISPVVLIDESTLADSDIGYPRVYPIGFEFQVPFESSSGRSGVYTSHIKMKVETVI